MFSTARIGLLRAGLADDHRHLGQAQRTGGRQPVKAGHELERVIVGPHDERDEHALQRDRPGQRLHVRLVERAHVVGHADQVERDPLPGFVDGAHVGSSLGLGTGD